MNCLVQVLLIALSASGEPKTVVDDFQQRVENYLKLRKSACERIPKLKEKAEPEEIANHERAQAEAIRSARAGAAQGDLFTPAVAAYFKDVIRAHMSGPGRRPSKEAARQGNPAEEGGVPVPLKVNAKYPDDAPLSTVPPALLGMLPQLPKEIDYRFVGRHLVLHDAQAGIIIDYLPNAMP